MRRSHRCSGIAGGQKFTYFIDGEAVLVSYFFITNPMIRISHKAENRILFESFQNALDVSEDIFIVIMFRDTFFFLPFITLYSRCLYSGRKYHRPGFWNFKRFWKKVSATLKNHHITYALLDLQIRYSQTMSEKPLSRNSFSLVNPRCQ